MPITDLLGFLGVRGDQRVQRDGRRSAPRVAAETPAVPGLVDQTHIVVVFAPVVAQEHHRPPSSVPLTYFEPETPGGDLMDQCSSWHDIPSALQATHQPAGHDLQLGIDPHSRFSKCSPAGGSVISLPRQAPNLVNAALIDSH